MEHLLHYFSKLQNVCIEIFDQGTSAMNKMRDTQKWFFDTVVSIMRNLSIILFIAIVQRLFSKLLRLFSQPAYRWLSNFNNQSQNETHVKNLQNPSINRKWNPLPTFSGIALSFIIFRSFCEAVKYFRA